MNVISLKLRNILALGFMFLILYLTIQPVFAHPFTTNTEPAGFAQLQQPPDKVILSFSEPVEQGFSSIKVTDSSGNRVDNDDTKYFQGDHTKLIVTLQSLHDDVYTVTSKVLSQVDGHVVEYTYAFVVGSPSIPIPTAVGGSAQPPVYLPESFARFPGLVGQVMIVGISFASLFLWAPIDRVRNLNASISQIRSLIDRRFAKLLIIGAILVIASGYAMIFVQAQSLGVGIEAALATNFGTTWIIRMIIAFVILGLYFAIRTQNPIRKIYHITILGVGLALLVTTTMIGHGAATTQPPAVALDFIHNIVASIWIGGLVYLGYVAIPSLRQLGLNFKAAIISLLVPRFSMMTVVILGIVSITGPLLLWMLESNINNLLITSYGKILISKLVFAGFMIGVGTFNQFNIHSNAIAVVKAGKTITQVDVHKRFNKSLKVESAIGIALLFSVALLTNTSLPAGELPAKTLSLAQAANSDTIDGSLQKFTQTQLADNAMVTLSIEPARVGLNNFVVSVTDNNGTPINDIKEMQIKLTQIKQGIGPLTSTLTKSSDANFGGNVAFTTTGRWNVQVLAERETALSIVALFDVTIKPTLAELGFKVEEYAMPANDSLPLYPLYHNGDLWVSDTAKPRIWNFNIETKQFRQYDLNGNLTTILDLDSKGNVWFLDPVSMAFGYLQPDTGKFKIYHTPLAGLPVSIDIDFNDNVWITLLDKNTIVKFVPSSEKFETFMPPTADSQPSAVLVDSFGTVWFTEAAAGKIAKLDPKTGSIEEFVPPAGPMAEPFSLIMDEDRNIWIGEHTGPKITRFDPTLHTFTNFPALDKKALPYGMSIDKFGNVWFAQHVTDNIGVLNPDRGNMVQVPVPTQTSFIQWLAIDDAGKIWFAEQRGVKIGSVTISPKSEGSTVEPAPTVTAQLIELKYADIVASAMSIAIIASSLFFVKSVHDLRRSIKVVSKSVL